MSKTFTEMRRHALNGGTMGTRWSALFHSPQGFNTVPIQAALQAAVDDVDTQMSTWKPESDLMRLNAAPAGSWVRVPRKLMQVLDAGLAIGRASGGAFDIGMGDAVSAWGFAKNEADPEKIRAAFEAVRFPAYDILELDMEGLRVKKHAPLALDFSGIAKGYGVDCLAETFSEFGITEALVSIDGELRALGLQPDGNPWTVAVEVPDTEVRAPYSILNLQDAAVATSGDYRHWIEVGGHHLSHTMDPASGGPLKTSPASVTVVARTCMEADAWATAMMVLGVDRGQALAQELGLDALFLTRQGTGIVSRAAGSLFTEDPAIEEDRTSVRAS
jgi:thiamine biosynthesis lipoprotein